jgi:hypothetical protein
LPGCGACGRSYGRARSTLRRTAVVVAVLAATAPTAQAAHLTVRGIVGPIAMDGPIVAAAYLSPRCDQVLAWNVRTGGRIPLAGRATCSLDLASTSGPSVSEVAVAGRRVAWITRVEGVGDIWSHAFTATLEARVETDLGEAVLTDDSSIGSAFSGLVDDRSILRYGSWTRRYQDPAGCPPEEACPIVTENPVLRGDPDQDAAASAACGTTRFAPAKGSGSGTRDGRLAVIDARGAVKTETHTADRRLRRRDPGLVYVSHAGTEYKTARSTLHLVPFERRRKLNP